MSHIVTLSKYIYDMIIYDNDNIDHIVDISLFRPGKYDMIVEYYYYYYYYYYNYYYYY